MKNIIKEACIDSIQDAKYYLENANKINRFETCSNLNEGGLTPNIELFNFINNSPNKVEQVIMIRNKNIFVIENNNDIEIMKNQIKEFASLGAKHFIFGYVTKENKVDKKTCKELIEVIKKFNDTTWNFHMAIDLVDNYDEAFEELIEMKFTRVLTKGGKDQAINNIKNLQYLNNKYGNKIEILVGGKVTKDNYEQIHHETNVIQFHGTKIA